MHTTPPSPSDHVCIHMSHGAGFRRARLRGRGCRRTVLVCVGGGIVLSGAMCGGGDTRVMPPEAACGWEGESW